MPFVNSFYSLEDFLGINKEIRDIITRYKNQKHDMELGDLQDMADDLSVLITQFTDAGGDMFASAMRAEVQYRADFLAMRDDMESHYSQSTNPETGKKFTQAFDRARYSAERELTEARLAAVDEKAMANKAHNVAEHARNVLLTMGRRIAILRKAWEHDLQMEEIAAKNSTAFQAAPTERTKPFRPGAVKDDGFDGWINESGPTQSVDELEQEALEIERLAERHSEDDFYDGSDVLGGDEPASPSFLDH